MGIFSRFTDIVNSNINSILDKAEDPEKMVRLIIQEMEDTLVEVRSTSAKSIAARKEISAQISRVDAQVDDWQSKAELAISKDRDDLARAALLEKQKAEDKSTVMNQELETVQQQISKLQDEVTQLQEKLADAKSRQKSIILRQKTASSRLDVKRQLDNSKVDNAMERFERYEQKIGDIESQADAYDLGKKTLVDEFAELEKDDNIDSELAALKNKVQAKKQTNADKK